MNNDDACKALTEFRERINALDRRILGLLNERTSIVEEIGQIKQACKMPVYEPKREDEVLRNIAEHNQGPLPQDAARRVFERIIDEMRTLQRVRMEPPRDGESR